jgi:hypothetical protein
LAAGRGHPRPNGAALDAENAIRNIAKLKNVTGHTLDGKIFVDTANGVTVRLQHYLVIGGVSGIVPPDVSRLFALHSI